MNMCKNLGANANSKNNILGSPFCKRGTGGDLFPFMAKVPTFNPPYNTVEISRHSGMDRRNPDCRDANNLCHPWSLGSGDPCRNDGVILNSTAFNPQRTPFAKGGKHSRKFSRLKFLGYLLAISLTCTPLAWAFNGIATDGSMGPAQVLSAPGVSTSVNIPQSLGTTVGNNLFHSFSTFNIETGQTVTFQENITNSLTNVISRVTGGSVSNLDGMLRSTPNGKADFYFINPAGVVFGANAQLDVAGAVHISTADQLNFQDGSHFSATNPNASSLSSTAPSSFGFLGTSIANNGLIDFNGTQLATKDGQTLDIVAGQIKIENSANLTIPQGEIRMVAMQGLAQVDFQPTTYGNLPLPDLSLLNANGGGDIEIKDSSILKTSLESGQGRVALWGGNISIVNSTLRADSYGNVDELPEQGISIYSASLSVDSSTIHTESHCSGKAGALTLFSTGNMDIVNGSSISTATSGGGDAGDLSLQAGNITLEGSATGQPSIASVALPGSSGNAGSINVLASNDIEILTNYANFANAQASINAPPKIAGASIASSSFGSGDTGNVNVKANNLLIDGFGLVYPSGIYATAYSPSTGKAGNVSVETAGDLKLFNNGEISSSTYGPGSAGDVTVKAGNIQIDGKASKYADISSETNDGTGNAGSVKVEASGLISLSNGGLISSSSFSQGDAGNVSVKANSLLIDGLGLQSFQEQLANFILTGIFAAALPGSTGKAGSVSVETVGDLKILNAGFISSATWGPGMAGDVNVQAGNIQIDGRGSPYQTGISSAAFPLSGGQSGNITVNASGFINIVNGGNISIENQGIAANPVSTMPGSLSVSAPNITLRDSIITSQSTQNVDASPIQIHFTHSLSLGNSFISTEAQNGNGGSITIQGGDSLTLANSGIRTSVLGQNGNGGDISVTANRLMMETGLIQANTAASGAKGGNVFLNVQTLLPSASMLIFGGNEPVNWDIHSTEFGWNVIQAAAPGGISGVINLTSPQLNLNGVLSNLGNPKFYSDTLNQDVCSMGTGSSLVRRGKGGMPAKSSDLLLFY